MTGKKSRDGTSGDRFFDEPGRVERYQSVFDGYPGQVAILDADGRIVEVNAGWERFGRENGLDDGSRFVGVNYFSVCQGDEGAADEDARRAEAGIREVLAGRLERFSMEYPCHSPERMRWFLLVATPLRHQDAIKGAIVSHLPITERKLAELALIQSEKHFNQAQRLARVGSFERDLETGVGYWSDELFRLIGLPRAPHSPPLRQFFDAVHPEDRERVVQVVARVRDQTQPEDFDFRIVTPTGEVRHLAASIALERDAHGRPVGYNGAMVDVTRLKEVEASLVQLAATDELTGIHNRRRFLELLRAELDRCERYGHPVSLAMLDIDNFKRINDTYGHAVGDEVLKGLAATIGGALRVSDVFGRIGGEEFAVILTETGPDMAAAACRRLVRAVAQTGTATAAGVLPLTISVGLATALAGQSRGGDTLPKDAACACDMTPDELLRRADQALYQAKAEGKNRVCFFEGEGDHASETSEASLVVASGACPRDSGDDVPAGPGPVDRKRT